MMDAADLPGQRQAAAPADEARHRDAVVRGAKRAGPVERPVTRQLAEQAAHLRHLERLAELEWRKDAWQAAGQHRLAGTGRAAHQEVVAPGGRYLQGALRLLLAVDLGQVVLRIGRWRSVFDDHPRRGRDGLNAEQVVDHGDQRRARDDLEVFDERRLRCVGRGHEDALVAKPRQPARGDEHAVDMPNRTVEGELAEERGSRRRRLMRKRERDCHCHRQVEPGALLAHLRRRQVHGETGPWELEAAVADRGADALACLFDCRRCEANQEELARIAAADVGLDVDPSHVQAGKHARVDASKHGLDVIEWLSRIQPWVLRRSSPSGAGRHLPINGEEHVQLRGSEEVGDCVVEGLRLLDEHLVT